MPLSRVICIHDRHIHQMHIYIHLLVLQSLFLFKACHIASYITPFPLHYCYVCILRSWHVCHVVINIITICTIIICICFFCHTRHRHIHQMHIYIQIFSSLFPFEACHIASYITPIPLHHCYICILRSWHACLPVIVLPSSCYRRYLTIHGFSMPMPITKPPSLYHSHVARWWPWWFGDVARWRGG